MNSKIFALLKKDFLNELSYKLAFILNFSGVIFSTLIYFFIGKLFGTNISSHLEYFGVSYFPYVLLNMAIFSYIGVGVGSFSSRLRLEQMQGTLESLVLTPTPIKTILFSMFLWNMIFATFDLGLYALLAIFLFQIDFSQINLFSTLIVFLLTLSSFASLGIISAAFVLKYKRGNPVNALLTALEGLFVGIYFPITIMPASLQIISALLPVTYTVRALQLAVYKGYSVYMLRYELGSLFLFSIILGPLSLWFFDLCLKQAKKRGTLSQY